MDTKLKVLLLYGGVSGEHEVSCVSAGAVLRGLDPARYDVVPVAIDRAGRWHLATVAMENRSAASLPVAGERVTLAVEPEARCLLSLDHPGQPVMTGIDLVFPVLHGPGGEDGTIQGLLELADLPYVGSGVLGSAAGMDKDAMKRLFRDACLPVPLWQTILRGRWDRQPQVVVDELEDVLGYPLFVKPANMGSSVGITKAHDREELLPAISLAFRYDRKVIVEQAVPEAREIEVAVLGNDQPQVSVPGEIIPGAEFYDYNDKYRNNQARLDVPAQLTERQVAEVQRIAREAFRAVDAAGLARVDCLLSKRGGLLYVNEINTMPGFTPISMYPKLWEASGIDYPSLVDRLVDLALARYAERHTDGVSVPERSA